MTVNGIVQTAAVQRSAVMQGVTIMLFAMIILPCMDAIAKYMAVQRACRPAR